MADVQPEKGTTRIANALYEALIRVRMPGRHKDAVHAILRLTYGWQKTQDYIGSTQLGELLGAHSADVRRILRDLERWGVITKSGGGKGRGDPPLIGVVKDFDKWEVDTSSEAQRKAHTRERGAQSPPLNKARGQTESEGTSPIKRGDKRDKGEGRPLTPKKTKETKETTTSAAQALAGFLLSELDSNVRFFRRPSSLDSWARTFDLMLRGTKQADPIPEADIRGVIAWVVRDDFWQGNVQSASKLREKFPTLYQRATCGANLTHAQRKVENTKNAAREVAAGILARSNP